MLEVAFVQRGGRREGVLEVAYLHFLWNFVPSLLDSGTAGDL